MGNRKVGELTKNDYEQLLVERENFEEAFKAESVCSQSLEEALISEKQRFDDLAAHLESELERSGEAAAFIVADGALRGRERNSGEAPEVVRSSRRASRPSSRRVGSGGEVRRARGGAALPRTAREVRA